MNAVYRITVLPTQAAPAKEFRVSLGHEMTVVEVVERAAESNEWWRERWTAGLAAAQRLSDAGVGYDDTVAFLEPHSDDVVSGLVGCWRLGAIPAMIDPRSDPTFYLENADPAYRVDDLGDLVGDGPAYNGPMPDADAGVFLSWTSGTTGKPKGVIVDSGPTALATSCIADRLRLRSDDVIICSNPVASSFQLVAALLPAAHAGCRFVPAEGLGAEELWEVVEREGGTVFVGYPLTLAEFVATADDTAGNDLRLALSGGSPLAPRLKREYRERLGIPLCESYGQSELGGFVALGDPADDDERFISHVGRPLPDRPAWTEPGPTGEIVVRGRAMRGYVGRPEATAEMLSSPGLRTGDVGSHDDDGYIRVLGRESDQLDDGRWPRDLEDELYAQPDVLHAAVIDTGEEVVAVVEPREGKSVSGDELAELVGLEECLVVESIPRTFSGKVDKIRMSREMGALEGLR